jgi:nucleotide-binding universal stress UspA family protein
MYNVLVAVDGSEHSRRAVSYAARRAQAMPCNVHLLHVEKDVMAWEVGPVSSGDDVASLREADSVKVLEDGASQFDASTHVERHAVAGDPAKAILDQASELGVDEIILGSRGLRPWGAVVLGSVAYKVVHDAHVAVVVVR